MADTVRTGGQVKTPRRSHRLVRVVAAIGTLVTVLPVVSSCTDDVGEPGNRPPAATPASDESATIGPAADRDLAVEDQLDDIAADIQHDTDGENLPGYAGLQIDVATRTVDVYWVGDPPADVHRIVTTAPSGITVNLRPATYDLQSMVAAVERVMAKYGDDIHAGSPTTEGTGIIIEWTAESAAKGPTSAELAAVARMPVTTEIGEPAEPAEG